MGGETTDKAVSYSTSLRGKGTRQGATHYNLCSRTQSAVLGSGSSTTSFRHNMAYITSAYYQPMTVLAVLHLITCFALVSRKTTEDVWKWTCERLALILRTDPQHVPPEWLRAPKFSFHPNPDKTAHYTFETRERPLSSAIWTERGGTGGLMTVGKNAQKHVVVLYTGNCLLHRLYEPATASMSHESARSNAYSATPHTGSRVRRHERDS